jgi:hypothetical protein
MKKIVFDVFFIITLMASLVAVLGEKWEQAIWLVLVLIVIEVDQVHDTLKAAHGIKE